MTVTEYAKLQVDRAARLGHTGPNRLRVYGRDWCERGRAATRAEALALFAPNAPIELIASVVDDGHDDRGAYFYVDLN